MSPKKTEYLRIACDKVVDMIGRPQDTDAAPFYHKYMEQVHGDDAVVAVESQLDEALELFAGISEERSLHRYAPEKWSLRQMLNHVNDAERMFAFRLLYFARGFENALPSFDPNIAAAGADADRVSWGAHVEEFRQVRLATISLYKHLPDEAWMRSGVASDNIITVRALAFIIPGHVAHHLRLLRERYLQ
jgi:DinB superfamily